MKKVCITLIAIFAIALPAFAEKSGKEAYELSCKACHGDNGAGGKDFGQGPNLTILKPEYAKAQFKAILDGKRKGPGTVNMLKTLKDSKLSEKEIQAAMEYAIKLPKAKSNHKNIGDAKIGKTKFLLCATCHGQKGEGYVNPAIPAPRIAGQADFYIVDQIKSFKAGHRGNDTPGGMQMKAMSGMLVTENDMKNVAAYLKSLGEQETKSEKK
jgi:uncharacterized protein